MLSSCCEQDGRPHSWSPWRHYDDGTGCFVGDFTYYRECMILGCNVWQQVSGLVPIGTIENFKTDRFERGGKSVQTEAETVVITEGGQAMSAKSINRPHAPHCALLCSGEETRPCDCGAVTQPRLALSLGVQSVDLLRRAIGRLDTDDQREAVNLGLKDALDEFVAANAPSPLEERLRALLAKKNMRSTPGDEHPLPFSDVLMVIHKALTVDLTPEPGEKPDEAQLGVSSFGRYDETRGFHLVIALAVADAEWVTVGIARSATRWAEPSSGWPNELQMHSNRWSEHRKRYLAWVNTKAVDRWSVPRAEAEELVKGVKS